MVGLLHVLTGHKLSRNPAGVFPTDTVGVSYKLSVRQMRCCFDEIWGLPKCNCFFFHQLNPETLQIIDTLVST